MVITKTSTGEGRQGDVPEPTDAICAVHRRGLVELLADVLKPGEVDDGVEAERPPERDAHEREPHPRLGGQPSHVVLDADLLEVVVQEADVVVEDVAEEHCDDRHAEHVRREVDRSEDGPPLELLVQHRGQEQRDDDQQRHGQDRDSSVARMLCQKSE
jgi:hypothetical protein